MKLLSILMLLLCTLFVIEAQEKEVVNFEKIAFTSTEADEYIYSDNQHKLILFESIKKPSKFVLAPEAIHYSKFNRAWRQNNILSISKDKRNDTNINQLEVVSFYDSRNQYFTIDKNEGTLTYYWQYDNVTDSHKRKTVYKNFEKRQDLLEAFCAELGIKLEEAPKEIILKYNSTSTYYFATETWSEITPEANKFIINHNANDDVLHHLPNNSSKEYTRHSKSEADETPEGERFALFEIGIKNGTGALFQVFENPLIGVKIIYEDRMVQYFNDYRE